MSRCPSAHDVAAYNASIKKKEGCGIIATSPWLVSCFSWNSLLFSNAHLSIFFHIDFAVGADVGSTNSTA
jgi:hypothetical protein